MRFLQVGGSGYTLPQTDMTSNTEHTIVEKDMTITEFYLSYDESIDDLRCDETVVGDSIGGYNAELSCTCGANFESFEEAKNHAEKYSRTSESR